MKPKLSLKQWIKILSIGIILPLLLIPNFSMWGLPKVVEYRLFAVFGIIITFSAITLLKEKEKKVKEGVL